MSISLLDQTRKQNRLRKSGGAGSMLEFILPLTAFHSAGLKRCDSKNRKTQAS